MLQWLVVKTLAMMILVVAAVAAVREGAAHAGTSCHIAVDANIVPAMSLDVEAQLPQGNIPMRLVEETTVTAPDAAAPLSVHARTYALPAQIEPVSPPPKSFDRTRTEVVYTLLPSGV